MNNEPKLCVDCGEELVERTNKSTGDKFYGCSAYPECKYTEHIDEDICDNYGNTSYIDTLN